MKYKKDFNDRTHSEFIQYMNLQLPYISKRDEVGGVISNSEWNDFMLRLAKVKDRVRKKRKRIMRRRKKAGRKVMPKKYIFRSINKTKVKGWKASLKMLMSHDDEDTTTVESNMGRDRTNADLNFIGDPDDKESDDDFNLPEILRPLTIPRKQ